MNYNIIFENILNILCLLGIVVFLFSLTFKVGNFLDIKKIFKDHIKIFNGNILQLISINITPIFLSLYIVTKQQITKDILDNVNVVITILTSMFFAILSILSAVDFKSKSKKYCDLVKETFNSTMFEIVCCLIILFISFANIFINNYTNTCLIGISSFLIYYFFIVVILNIFIIVKRIKVVFEKNITD